MAAFQVAGNKGTASVRSIVNARAAASGMARGFLYEYEFGNIDTPADNAFDHQILRSSTAPTGAANTPNPNDPAEAAAVGFVAMDTVTVDPTFGAIMFRCPVNQRASFRWVCTPWRPIIWPATANNGLTGAIAAAATNNFSGTFGLDCQ